VVIILAILAGIGCTIYDLRLILSEDYRIAFKPVLVDIFMLFAVGTVMKTALNYFREGRVKLTYIIDTVTFSFLAEITSCWHRVMDWQKVAMVIVLLLSLACIRIIAVRYSPRRIQLEF
jgi:uncharacterized membrane protein (DUF373 family)